MPDFHYQTAPFDGGQLLPLDRFLGVKGDTRAILASGGEKVVAMPPLWPGAEIEPYPGAITPDVAVYKLDNVTVVGPSILLRDEMALFPTGCYPVYVEKWITSGWLAGRFKNYCNPSDNAPVLEIDTAYVPFHFNAAVYGHFLGEVVPALLAIKALQSEGLTHPILMPSGNYTWVADIVAQICPENPIVTYDPQRQIAKVAQAILPSAGAGPYFAVNKLVRNWFHDLARSAPEPELPHDRLFIIRDKGTSFRFLENHDELKDICLEAGFHAVAPEKLPWMQQVGLFHNSKVVVGELTSSLHNTIFCKPETRVLILNRIGRMQDGIGASFGHRNGYILPEDGRPRVFERDWKERQNFRISVEEFKDRLAILCDGD